MCHHSDVGKTWGLQVTGRSVSSTQWFGVMLEMNLTLIPILKFTPAEPSPVGARLKTMVPLTLGDALLPRGAGGVALALRYRETDMQRAEHRSDAPFILVFFAPSFPWLET